MSSVGFKASKTSKIVRLFHLTLKIPTITKELLSKCLSFAETKVEITEDDKKIM